jgi:GT2 family glycosyltransferase
VISIVIPTIKRQEAVKTGRLAVLSAGCDTNIIISEDAKRQGFTKTVNAGLEQTTTEDVCILNDDIEWFSYGWLEMMRRALYFNQYHGIAGPTGKSSTSPMRHGYPGMRGIRVVDHLPFWCVLVKRETFNRIGYLDADLVHYGSDNLFCWKAARAGMQSVWVRDVYLKHTHHGSGLILEWKDMDDITIERKVKLLERGKL